MLLWWDPGTGRALGSQHLAFAAGNVPNPRALPVPANAAVAFVWMQMDLGVQDEHKTNCTHDCGLPC